jgi:hypothetical protein
MENVSIERLNYRLELPTNDLDSDAQIPTQKQKKYKKQKENMTPPKLNNSTIINNKNDVDETEMNN